MRKIIRVVVNLAGLVSIFLSMVCCKDPIKYQFDVLRKDKTGLNFSNNTKETVELNVFNYLYFFNGGGIAAGDFNKDGKVDLFFTSNTGSNGLFINQGNLKFKDVTHEAHIEGIKGWTTGASVVDINNDGLLDIYVSQVGDYGSIKGANQLYICTEIKEGIPVFEEQANKYGLALIGFGTQACFFDYDLDGDLDMFQLNHSVHENGTYLEREHFANTQHPTAGDKLLRNDSGKFVEVTMKAGILSTAVGYGLGVATSDVNLDGWPDIYVGNDFHENDYLYINQQDGTFKEVLTEQIMHTSKFSMGVDMGDINNDAFTDIISLDMLPYDPVILKSSLGDDTYDVFNLKLRFGYSQQFARNNLQLNNGDGTFSEIGMFAGVNATDWSWAPLFVDFDHDGYKDLFISNGIPRRMNDIDYINYRESNEEFKMRTEYNHIEDKQLAIIENMPQIKLPNKFFRNTHNLKFADIDSQIKDNPSTYSNGAVFADLDNDGDLEIIVNNIEDEPFIYNNMTMENNDHANNYLSFDLHGSSNNVNAVGATVIVYKQKEKLFYENFPVKGFQSSMQTALHIGVGDTTRVDSVLLIWPDHTYEKLKHIKFNSVQSLKWSPNLPKFKFERLHPQVTPLFDFVDLTPETGIDYKHKENTSFIEFNREPLIPKMVSREGPAVAVGDLNGDGLDDVYFGAAKWERSALYFQDKNGHFTERTDPSIINDSTCEDVDAVFADIENDGDLDIIVASGGNEFWGSSEYLAPRIYVNDGKGNFEKRFVAPGVFLTASCVLAADFNKDGKIDLFFGGRIAPNHHGKIPASYLLQNKGGGEFEDVTGKYSSELQEVGMVKKGAWSDIDTDGDLDLILALEWKPITIFLNENNNFKKVEIGDEKGWWNFVLPYDFDGDGDIDLLAGNAGLNTRLKPTTENPIKMYVNDFDGNGKFEQILTYHIGQREIPFANYGELMKQMPALKKRYSHAKDFAKASVEELLGKERVDEAQVLTANCFESAYFENTGKGLYFDMHPLADILQVSSLQAASILKHSDQKTAILLGGNFYDNAIEMGRYDANYGDVLSFDKAKQEVYSLGKMKIKGQVKQIIPINIRGKACYILARNNEPVLILGLK